MKTSTNYCKDGYVLREMVNLFNNVDFERSDEKHEFNDVYQSMLAELQSAGSSGEFYTNRAITSWVIEKLDPKPGERVGDFACGTGGFLSDALKHMEKKIPLGDTKQMELLQDAVHGGELKELPYKLAVVNMFLHGIERPDIVLGDSLNIKNVKEYAGLDLMDVVAFNPPYGGIASEADKMRFPAELRSSETADLFVALVIHRLKKGGRAAAVLPDGFLFGNDSAKTNIKKLLMTECNLHTIIRLPQSCFAPYTSIATNLLFFEKGTPTHETWFYRLDLVDGKKFSLTKNPMKREHFNPVDEWWKNRVEIIDEKDNETMSTTYKAKKFTYEEIENSNFNLDRCGYPVEEKVILSPDETVKNFIARREDLERRMDEKLEEIMKLLGVK